MPSCARTPRDRRKIPAEYHAFCAKLFDDLGQCPLCVGVRVLFIRNREPRRGFDVCTLVSSESKQGGDVRLDCAKAKCSTISFAYAPPRQVLDAGRVLPLHELPYEQLYRPHTSRTICTTAQCRSMEFGLTHFARNPASKRSVTNFVGVSRASVGSTRATL